VKLTDRGASITLTWLDPSDGTAAFLVTGTDPQGRQLSAQQVPQGQTTATFNGLRSSGRYCFRVIAVYSVDNVKPAPAACTNRRQ
jgi:hypothetical protein